MNRPIIANNLHKSTDVQQISIQAITFLSYILSVYASIVYLNINLNKFTKIVDLIAYFCYYCIYHSGVDIADTFIPLSETKGCVVQE